MQAQEVAQQMHNPQHQLTQEYGSGSGKRPDFSVSATCMRKKVVSIRALPFQPTQITAAAAAAAAAAGEHLIHCACAH
eukprot:1156475-Pelagomonas_calceolata.AAC.9